MSEFIHVVKIDGTNAERVAYDTGTLTAGWLWYETDTGKFYKWDGSEWGAIGGGWDRDSANGELYPSTIADQVGVGTQNPDRMLHSEVADAGTNTVVYPLRLTHSSSGATVAGLGVGAEFELEDYTGTNLVAASLYTYWLYNDAMSDEISALAIAMRYQGATMPERVALTSSYYTLAGAARGENATDMQGQRSNASEVASGNDSTICGGSDGTASGAGSVVLGGYGCISSGIYAVAGGLVNTAAGEYSVAIGFFANAYLYGQHAFANGSYNYTRGDCQRWSIQLFRTVTHSTTNWYDLYTNGSYKYLEMPADGLWHCDIKIIGTTQGGGSGMDSAAYTIECVVENDNGTTVLKYNSGSNVLYEDDANWDVRVAADNANDRLLIQVSDSGSSGATVRWQATVYAEEIAYP